MTVVTTSGIIGLVIGSFLAAVFVYVCFISARKAFLDRYNIKIRNAARRKAKEFTDRHRAPNDIQKPNAVPIKEQLMSQLERDAEETYASNVPMRRVSIIGVDPVPPISSTPTNYDHHILHLPEQNKKAPKQRLNETVQINCQQSATFSAPDPRPPPRNTPLPPIPITAPQEVQVIVENQAYSPIEELNETSSPNRRSSYSRAVEKSMKPPLDAMAVQVNPAIQGRSTLLKLSNYKKETSGSYKQRTNDTAILEALAVDTSVKPRREVTAPQVNPGIQGRSTLLKQSNYKKETPGSYKQRAYKTTILEGN